jgi:hypothetical protein
LVEGGGEEAGGVGVAAGEGDDGAVDAAGAGEWVEFIEQLGAQVAVSEGDGGLGEFSHED